MTAESVVREVIRALEALEAPYMIVGSLSSNLYGIPRSTQDADFVVQFEPSLLVQVKHQLGPEFKLDPQVRFETVTATTRQRMQHVASAFEVDFFHVSVDPHDQERFARRVRTTVFGAAVWAPTAEDVVIQKLRWAQHAGRSKDRDDARDVLAVQGDALDWGYVHRWCDLHGTRALLEELRASISGA